MMMQKMLCAVLAWAAVCAQAADVPVMNVPTVNQRLRSAREAVAAGQWKEAQRQLLLVVAAEPGWADAHNLLAYTYRKQPQTDLPKAFEHYGVALRLNPQHLGAHEYIGEAYLMAHQPAQAQQHLVALERICGNRQCEEYQDLARAIAAYQQARPAMPHAPASGAAR